MSKELVETVPYLPEGRGFDFQLGHWDLSMTILPAALCPWGRLRLFTEIITMGISWGKGGRCVGLITFSTSCADCLEILGVSTSCSPQDLSRPVMR